MTLYHAYLEEDESGTCLAHVPDLAGCTAAGASRAEALAALPAAIRAYLDWCGAHGDPLPEDGEITVDVADVMRGYRPWQRGGANALFSADRAPLGDAELRTYLRRMGYARGDLLALIRSLRAPGVLPEGDGSWLDLVAHVAGTEAWYLSRLGQRIAAESVGSDPFQYIIDARARALEAVLRLSPRQRDLVYVPTEQPSEDPEEGWTLRKVLRCCLEHDLHHLHVLRARYPGVAPAPAGTRSNVGY